MYWCFICGGEKKDNREECCGLVKYGSDMQWWKINKNKNTWKELAKQKREGISQQQREINNNNSRAVEERECNR